MGTWGAKLYQDDLALDIKEDYIEKLKSGKTNEQALNEMLEMYEESKNNIGNTDACRGISRSKCVYF